MTTQFPSGHCFFISCHASLEHDLGDLFKELGVQIVQANNACSHEERPCIPGYTDHDFTDDLRARVNTMSCRPEDFDGTNFIFLMNTDDFQHRVAYFAKFRPVIVYLFGQHTDLQLAEFAGKMNVQWENKLTPNIFAVCYSKREYEFLKPRVCTEIHHHLHYIRFAKRLEHYWPWKGQRVEAIKHIRPDRLPFVFTASNSIHHRGDGCGWPQLQQIRGKVPHILTGNDTQEVGGTGRVTFDELRQLMWTCGAYVTFPAWPAPIVMNMQEAMLSGCPTAFYDNGQGAKEEGIFNDGVGCLSSDVGVLVEYCQRSLRDKEFQKDQSKRCQERAIELYEFSRQLPGWITLFNELSKLW
jgi:hypothetical protein